MTTLLNDERARARCPALREDRRLRTAALDHSTEMATRATLGHTSADGGDPATRMRRAGYPQARGEAVALGYATVDDVVHTWLADPRYRGALLDCRATTLGVGVAYRGRAAYWTADLGG